MQAELDAEPFEDSDDGAVSGGGWTVAPSSPAGWGDVPAALWH